MYSMYTSCSMLFLCLCCQRVSKELQREQDGAEQQTLQLAGEPTGRRCRLHARPSPLLCTTAKSRTREVSLMNYMFTLEVLQPKQEIRTDVL